MSLAAELNRAWLQRGWLAMLLWPLSMLMRGLVATRRQAYQRGWMKSERLPVPVLVVGNRVLGGAGKTPTTIALLEHLKSRGWQPGVLSRGYRADGGGAQPVLIDARTAPGLQAQATGDEPMLIWRRAGVPIMVGRDRVASGQALLRAHPDIDMLVCDDGLQHLRLQRDIEVIVFDERGAGNGWLLPAGPLREPIDVASPDTLRAPPIVLYNANRPSTDLPGHVAQWHTAPLRPLQDWWHSRPASATLAPDQTRPQAACAVAGIAHPQRFFDALARQGFAVEGIALDDHADFATLPWPASARDVIVTEKDAVKLPPERVAAERPGCRVWVAALDFRPEDSFWAAVDAALALLPISPAKPDQRGTPHKAPPTP
jgi:tetraacyldisaccharide 4'-kinase